jgi:chromate transporter
MLARHWATDRQFASAIAIGQLAPGPTGLWVVAFGYLTAGFTGAVLMTVAALLPPLIVVPIGHFHSKVRDMVLVRGFARGLTVGVAGAVPTILVLRVLATYGFDLSAILLFSASLALLATKRVPPLAVLLLGAAAGIVLFTS